MPGLQIGLAEYEEDPTGCTVFVFPKGAVTAVDMRGGMVGQVEEDYGYHHAICFAGGSLLGLEAVSGVRAALLSQWRSQNPPNMPFVGGAIIWDWFGRDNATYPDKTLGQAATTSAQQGRFYYGKRGAGRWAGVGQGGAFRQIGETGKHTTLTIVVTNQEWSQGELNQIGRQVHSSMARAIQPFHTMQDGDLLFTTTTATVENETLKSTTDFGLIASELA